ncbi:MAG: hypothetical protein RI897_996 [Verrucomicrobiota bacterium]|jgi:hypothetical protein
MATHGLPSPDPTKAGVPQEGARPAALLRTAAALLALLVSFALWLTGIIPDSWQPFLPSLFASLLLALYCFLRLPASRPILTRCLLLYLTVGITLTGADLTLRVTLRNRFNYRPHDMFIRVWQRLPLLTRYQQNVHYHGQTYGDLAAFSPNPELQVRRNVEFETDAFGFRNRRQSTRRDEPYDLILLGDSFVAGCGNSQSNIWSEQLEQRHGLHTYNLGLPGDPGHAYLNLIAESPRLTLRPAAHVVLAIFTGNDLTQALPEAVENLPLPWQKPSLAFYNSCLDFRNHSSLHRLWERLQLGRDPLASQLTPDQSGLIVRSTPDGQPMLFYRHYTWMLDATEETAKVDFFAPDLQKILQHCQAFCDTRQLQFDVVLIPAKEEILSWILEYKSPWSGSNEPSLLGRRLARFCQQQGIGFLDLKPHFAAASRELYETQQNWLWWPDDSHWNPQGYRLAADLLQKFLLQPKPEPEQTQ